MIPMEPEEHVQGFRAVHKTYKPSTVTYVDPDDVIHIDCNTDPNTQEEFILWDDIQQVFEDALFVRQRTKMVPFVKGSDYRPLEPRRIVAVPGVVLDVIVGGDLEALTKVASPHQHSFPQELPKPGLPLTTPPTPKPMSPSSPAPQKESIPAPPLPQKESIPAPPVPQKESILAPPVPQKASIPEPRNPVYNVPKASAAYSPHINYSIKVPAPSVSSISPVPSIPRQEGNGKKAELFPSAPQQPRITPVRDTFTSPMSRSPQATERDSHSRTYNPITIPPSATLLKKKSFNPQDHVAATIYTSSDDLMKLLHKATFADEKAHADLQSIYKKGDGLDKDARALLEWYFRDYDQGGKQDHLERAERSKSFRSVHHHPSLIMASDLKDAKQGDKDAQLKVGRRYENGRGVDPDASRAFEWCLRSAHQGLAEAQFKVAKAYEQGCGVLQDDSKALAWLVKAASQGHAGAQFTIGGVYESGRGVPRNYSMSMKWLLKAAVQGFEVAQLEAGHSYQYGGRRQEDDSMAFRWYLTTAERGNRDAQLLVANLYESGRGVTQDYSIGFEWYLLAAEQGDLAAQLEVARKYSMGHVVPQDDARAFQWYLKAAKQGNKSAQQKVAEWYEYGRGVPQDDAKAMTWYIKLAEHGDEWVIYFVAERFEIGRGVPLSLENAIEWYALAVQAGRSSAQQDLDRLLAR
ncbi:hypothetical protein EC991_007693 [Linnemannia zychae]|nr:hypothetical protein EC991_007693 [Linnemannia zychae]